MWFVLHSKLDQMLRNAKSRTIASQKKVNSYATKPHIYILSALKERTALKNLSGISVSASYAFLYTSTTLKCYYCEMSRIYNLRSDSLRGSTFLLFSLSFYPTLPLFSFLTHRMVWGQGGAQYLRTASTKATHTPCRCLLLARERRTTFITKYQTGVFKPDLKQSGAFHTRKILSELFILRSQS